MTSNYKTEATLQLAADIKKAGFRVFIAKSGSYGFFTDAEGTRVVSFQYDLGGFKFSGNYKSDNPRRTGNGWVMGTAVSGNHRAMFDSHAPQWAVHGAEWQHTTLAQHLATYGASSAYVEYQVSEGQ